jgi:hypothetical protein
MLLFTENQMQPSEDYLNSRNLELEAKIKYLEKSVNTLQSENNILTEKIASLEFQEAQRSLFGQELESKI